MQTQQSSFVAAAWICSVCSAILYVRDCVESHCRRSLPAGDSGVGKTSLIVRVSQGQFTPVHSTLGLDFTTKTLIVGEERVVFQLWDTAGQERWGHWTSL